MSSKKQTLQHTDTNSKKLTQSSGYQSVVSPIHMGTSFLSGLNNGGNLDSLAPLAARSLQRTIGNRAIGQLRDQEVRLRRLPFGVGPAAAKAIPLIADIIGTTVTVAEGIGTLNQKQNKQAGRGRPLKLDIQADYLMSKKSEKQLSSILLALYLNEMERLGSLVTGKVNSESNGPKAESTDKLGEIALNNVKQKSTDIINAKTKKYERSEVANGGGKRTKISPWGEAKVTVEGGRISPDEFDNNIFAIAKKHHIIINKQPVTFAKYCDVDFNYEADVDLFSNDNIYVRGESLDSVEAGNEIAIKCLVAFDWDGDTTYFRWIDSSVIRLGVPIPEPIWQGPEDPDD